MVNLLSAWVSCHPAMHFRQIKYYTIDCNGDMGQPNLYKTQEEKVLAAQTYQMKYYQRYRVHFSHSRHLDWGTAVIEMKLGSSSRWNEIGSSVLLRLKNLRCTSSTFLASCYTNRPTLIGPIQLLCGVLFWSIRTQKWPCNPRTYSTIHWVWFPDTL